MWILTVCIGILWGGMCERTLQYVYPTEQACLFEKDRLSRQIRDGYTTCTTKEK